MEPPAGGSSNCIDCERCHMKFVCIFLLTLLLQRVSAQFAPGDSALLSMGTHNAAEAYNDRVKGNLHLYNGTEYRRPGNGIKGIPFFITDSLVTGAIFYDGSLYTHVPLRYDMVTDDVITNNYTQDKELKLVPEKISYFLLPEHAFVRITADSTMPSFITTGLYEKLYEGKMTVLARRSKLARPLPDNINKEYVQYDDYFVLLNNIFYKAGNSNDFLRTMEDKKEEIRKYIKEQHIRFNKNREASMVKLADYYSQLKN